MGHEQRVGGVDQRLHAHGALAEAERDARPGPTRAQQSLNAISGIHVGHRL